MLSSNLRCGVTMAKRHTIEAAPPAPKEPNWFAVAAFLLGSLAVLLGSLPLVDVVSKTFSALGLILGVVACVLPSAKEKKYGIGFPIGAAAISLLALLFAGPWPGKGKSTAKETGLPDPTRITQVADDQGMSAPRVVNPDEWVDPERGGLQQNDVRVVIKSVTLEPLVFQDDPKPKIPPKEKLLLIKLQVSYVGALRKVDFTGWDRPAEVRGTAPFLADDQGRPIKSPAIDPRRKVVGQAEPTSLTPGRAVEDLLVFAAPPAGTDVLYLELPASAFGGTGAFHFAIPKEMIRVPEEAKPKEGATP